MAELLLRPWAGVLARDGYLQLPPRPPGPEGARSLQRVELSPFEAPLLLCEEGERQPRLDDRHGDVVLQATYDLGRRRGCIYAPTRPLRPDEGLGVFTADGGAQFVWPGAPAIPVPGREAESADDRRREAALQRVLRIHSRIRDVEAALDEPLHLWEKVSSLWEQAEHDANPLRDVIVGHARDLPPVLERLLAAPRKILRRTPGLQRLDRVQEMDRAAMLWLARQPGETMEERAGSDQRIRAPVRVESLDTLENRVLRSLAELSAQVARSYLRAVPAGSQRHRSVDRYRRLCLRIAQGLRDRGVRKAPATARPNYVLQQDPSYQRVWTAWLDLLRRSREKDELWRWQARAWEEFCGLALVIALQRLPGARLVAASPLSFRQEQAQGLWLLHDNPLAVFHLADQGLVVEVQVRDRKGGLLDLLCAPVWLRIADFSGGFQRRVAVWPMHGFADAADPDEAERLLDLLAEVPRLQAARGEAALGGTLTAAIVLRPGGGAPVVHRAARGATRALSATLGPSGEALSAGLAKLSGFCIEVIAAEAV